MAIDPSPRPLQPALRAIGDALPLGRTRLALAMISLVGVALELALMRTLSLRFYSNFSSTVISVGLLGFSAAGSLMTLFRARIMRHQRAWLFGLALALAAAVPVIWWLAQLVPLDVAYLLWNFSQSYYVLALELFMFIPFLLVGAFVCVALMDRPERINGHYAADLLGSGTGSALAVLAMHLLTTIQLLLVLAAIAYLAALLLIDRRNRRAQFAALFALVFVSMTSALMPWEPAFFARKSIAAYRNMDDVRDIYRTEGPLGRIDASAGSAVHSAPGMSLQYHGTFPPTADILIDGAGATAVYDSRQLSDWNFADFRTAAVAFYVLPEVEKTPRVCVINAGGGLDVGLALFHHAGEVVALEPNQQIIDTLTGPLADRGGDLYRNPIVHPLALEPRGFFASTADTFDVIQIPPVGGFGASGSGLSATQESYLYTVESFRIMLDHLTANGVLAVTRSVQDPPREELRSFDLAVQALRQKGIDPATHTAMIRSPHTTTVLVFQHAMEPAQSATIREFCAKRSFDLCELPGLTEAEAMVFNVPQHNYFFRGPQALLGTAEQRAAFLASYQFEVAAPTDDKPYFFSFVRWGSLDALRAKYGANYRSYLEIGYLLVAAALLQAILLGIVFVLLPLAPGVGSLRRARGKFPCLTYFLMIGLGFMLLEMGFVQKLVLYLAHPIYSAAVVIGSFLVFAGVGSQTSGQWRAAPRKIVTLAVTAVAALGLIYLLAMDPWLHLTQAWPMMARCIVAGLTIAPLAFGMGHLLPLGLKRAAETNPLLVPWSWAVNGFASVVATSATPLLAMQFGFGNLVLIAIGCYALAAVAFYLIPAPETSA